MGTVVSFQKELLFSSYFARGVKGVSVILDGSSSQCCLARVNGGRRVQKVTFLFSSFLPFFF